MSSDENQDRVRMGFQKVLDSHGYGFQYAVQAHLTELSMEGPASWQFEAAELPVGVRGRETRIDFVYKTPPGLGYLVGECKRVNSGMDWCFIRGGEVARRHGERALNVEGLQRTHQDRARAVTVPFRRHHRWADVGRELRAKQRTSAETVSGRSSIENAVTQVLTGVSGLSALVSQNWEHLPFDRPVTFIPVVFTTARLWFSDRTLADADLVSGKLALDRESFHSVPWIPLQYHQSASLVSEVHRETLLQSAADHLVHLHRRAVFIVNVHGIRQFMEWTLTDQG